MHNFQEQLAQHRKNGGSTFNISKGDLSGESFYSVSIYKNCEVVSEEPIQLSTLIDFVSNNFELLLDKANALGTWKDEKTGLEYMDIVCMVENLETALNLAKAHDQKAIFNLSTGETIYL